MRKALPAWREELSATLGSNALTNIGEIETTALELTSAHPAGIARLYAAKPTALNLLLREGNAYSRAFRQAKEVVKRAEELASQHGGATLYLAIGLATWTELRPPVTSDGKGEEQNADENEQSPAREDDPAAQTAPAAAETAGEPGLREFSAPVLLRPVSIEVKPHTDGDIELCLQPGIEVNPALLAALRKAGSTIAEGDIARAVVTDHGFTPRPALQTVVEEAQRRLQGFHYDERLVIAPFVNPGQLLLADLDALEGELAGNLLISAIAGESAARKQLAKPLPTIAAGDREPDSERGVGDLSPAQQQVVETAASRRSFMVDVAPGANETDVIAAVLADAAASGLHVALVSGNVRRAQANIATINRRGLAEMVLDFTSEQWRTTALERLRSGFVEYDDDLDDAAIIAARKDLIETRQTLGNYIAALHQNREPWDVSAHTALQELARITAVRPAARTKVRFDEETLLDLNAERREELIAVLEDAGEQGMFTLRRAHTAWYGAQLANGQEADRALRRAERLANQLLPELLTRAEAICAETGLAECHSAAELDEQLQMLQGVRAALDMFLPQIFESSAAQMVVATASKQWREDHDVVMRASTRRRLRKQARDMVRPGRQVDDLHGALVDVQRQAIIWRKHCPGGSWPRLPQGLAATESLLADVISELKALGPVLQKDLLTEPFSTLVPLLHELATDVEGLANLPQRTELSAKVRALGGERLLSDFVERRLPVSQVRCEVELAWWASLLEHVISTDPLLARYSGAELVELAERFRTLDRAQIDSLPGPVRRAIARRLQRVVTADKETAREFYRELAGAHPDNLRSLMGRYRELAQALRPAWVLTPAQISQLLAPTDQIDVVVLDALHHTPTAHLLGVLARAKQVVVFADPRRHQSGAVEDLAAVLPHLELPTDRADREEHVAAFLAGHGYDGLVDSIPAPPSRSTMRLELVDGFGMPALGSASVESVQSEVDRVVDLVVDHALTHPDRSLAVITLNERHAARVGAALKELVATSPAIADFFAASSAEPFVVTDIAGAQGLVRDTVILSVGYGKTPHGRVLHRLGKISGPDGLALLIDALDDVRRELVVVSCFTHEDLDRTRLRAPGAELLYDLLAHVAQKDHPLTAGGDDHEAIAPDRLLIDLADRLWQLGLTVVPRYGLPGGVRIPLAIGHPSRPGELLVAVVTDDESYVQEPSIRVRERHRVERLRQRGWSVYQAFSTSVFLDPQAEAERIVALVVQTLTDQHAGESQPPAETPGDEPEIPETTSQPGDGEDEQAGAEQHEDNASGAEEDPVEDSEAEDAPGAPTAARGPRPAVAPGLPLAAYSDDQLDDLVAWIASDNAARSDAEFLAELRKELALSRRGAQLDAVLLAAIRRREGAQSDE